MLLNHRAYDRQPISEPVTLHSRGVPLGFGRVKNLSPEGMLIKVSPKVLRDNDFFSLEFFSKPGRRADHCLIPVIVVHRCADGVGVLFDNSDQRVTRTIETLLSHDAASNPAGLV